MSDDALSRSEPHRPTPESSVAPQSLFGGPQFPAASAAEPLGARTSRAKRSPLQRAILPLGLLLVAIAALAWISQFLPNWTGKSDTTGPPPREFKPAIVVFQPDFPDPKEDSGKIRFRYPAPSKSGEINVGALWDPTRAPKNQKSPFYYLEFEPEDSGFYDFVFVNQTSEPAEIGMDLLGCKCSQVRMCVLPADTAKKHVVEHHRKCDWARMPPDSAEADYGWETMKVDHDHGLQVPAGQGGLVRILWSGERAKDKEKDQVELTVDVWAQAPDKPQERIVFRLVAPLVKSPPVRFAPEQIDFGDLADDVGVEREFWCWSPTRSELTIDFPENKTNPCVQCVATALNAEERLALNSRLLDDGINSRALAAYRVTVTAFAKKDGQQLDTGVSYKKLPVSTSIKGTQDGPDLKFWVEGDVTMAGRRQVELDLGSFAARNGVKGKTFTLLADPAVTLKIGAVHPAQLKVQLQKKGPAGEHTAWEVTVNVPPNGVVSGPLTKSYVIVESSRDKMPESGKRQMRIPIVGTATSSGF